MLEWNIWGRSRRINLTVLSFLFQNWKIIKKNKKSLRGRRLPNYFGDGSLPKTQRFQRPSPTGLATLSFPEHFDYKWNGSFGVLSSGQSLGHTSPSCIALSRSPRTRCFLVTWILAKEQSLLFLYEFVSLLLPASFASSPRGGLLLHSGKPSPLKLSQARQRKQDPGFPHSRER